MRLSEAGDVVKSVAEEWTGVVGWVADEEEEEDDKDGEEEPSPMGSFSVNETKWVFDDGIWASVSEWVGRNTDNEGGLSVEAGEALADIKAEISSKR